MESFAVLETACVEAEPDLFFSPEEAEASHSVSETTCVLDTPAPTLSHNTSTVQHPDRRTGPLCVTSESYLSLQTRAIRRPGPKGQVNKKWVGGSQDAPKKTYPRGIVIPTVGIICAQSIGKAAVEAILDEKHSSVQNDLKDYTFGKLGAHEVVIACVPARSTASAATIAEDVMRCFGIRFGLMVGVGGGVWSEQTDIRLGDVVVSRPDGMQGGMVQWDYDKMERDGVFLTTGNLRKPPRLLLNAVQGLEARQVLADGKTVANFGSILKYPVPSSRYLGTPSYLWDQLFESDYQHIGGPTCDNCDKSHLVKDRPRRTDRVPRIHYGKIASSNKAMKHGSMRDRIAREEGILCFDMEAAGLVDTFPCVVIRGVCDYADSHRPRYWQDYAVAVAAAYAKELLLSMPPAHEAIFATSSALDSRKHNAHKRPRHVVPRVYPVADTSTVRYTLDGIDSPSVSSTPDGPSLSPARSKKLKILQRIKPCYVMVDLGLLSIGGSLAVGLFYSIAQDRMGDGFTTAGWMVAVSTLMLAAPMAKHYPHCRCWDSRRYEVL